MTCDVLFQISIVSNFTHDTIAVGFNIQYISLNSDDSIIFIVYQDGGELKLGAIDVAIVKNSVSEKIIVILVLK